MRVLAAFLLITAIALPARSAVIWDESVNGPLSTNVASPTLVVFAVGSNTIKGSVINGSGQVRDIIRFEIPAGHLLTSIFLHQYSVDNTGFAAINEGVHSFVPSPETELFFTSGIHVNQSDVGSDLMDLFVTRAVTAESLFESELPPGKWCFLIQNTSPVLVNYELEFILTGPVSTEITTWGAIKALYR